MRFFVIVFVAYSLLARAQQAEPAAVRKNGSKVPPGAQKVQGSRGTIEIYRSDPPGKIVTAAAKAELDGLMRQYGEFRSGSDNFSVPSLMDFEDKYDVWVRADLREIYDDYRREHNAAVVGAHIIEHEIVSPAADATAAHIAGILRGEAIRQAPTVAGIYLQFKNDQREQNKLSLLAMMKPSDRQLLNCAPQTEVENCDQFDSRDHRRWEDISGQFNDCFSDLANKLQKGTGVTANPECANNVRTGVRNFIRESSNYQVYDGTNRPPARAGASRAQP